jgi:hypothetical protein
VRLRGVFSTLGRSQGGGYLVFPCGYVSAALLASDFDEEVEGEKAGNSLENI